MNDENKQQYIGSIAFFTSCFIICILILLIHIFVQDQLDTEYILENLVPALEFFTAETSEKISYLVSVVSFPFIFWGLYLFFKRKMIDFSPNKLKTVILTELILGIIVVPIFTMFSDLTKHLYALNFFMPIIPFLTIFIFIAAFILYEKKSKYSCIATFLIFSIILFYIICIFLIYNTPTYATSDLDMHHFEAYFYPIYKTLSGMTPGIDFHNLYGFYPYIYSLFFNIDNISIQSISLFNASMVALILIFLAIILFVNIKNKMLAFLIYNVCILYSLFATYNTQISRHGVYYLQYMPHRVFFVMLIALLITIYLKINCPRKFCDKPNEVRCEQNFGVVTLKGEQRFGLRGARQAGCDTRLDNEKAKKILEYIGYIVCSVAIFWNIESGIAALAGWGSLHFYLNLNKKDRLKQIIKVFIKTSLSVFIAFFAIFICTYIQSHQIINPVSMFFGQFVFYAKGFYLKKMDIIEQPFVLVVIVYLIALSNSIISAVENRITQTDILKFTFSVIGFGLFTYYQGRSHVLCLIACSWPMYILIGILMQEYFNKYKESNSVFISRISMVKFALLFVLVSAISTSCIFYMLYMPNNIKLIREVVLKSSIQIENLKQLKVNEEYDFLTQDASFYYMHFKQPDKLPFSGLCDCFFKEDLIKIDNYLKHSDKKLVVDSNIFKIMSLDYLYKYYNLLTTNGYIYVFEKKK